MQEKIAAIIPCYRVKAHILDVIGRIGGEVGRIYVVDDACPEHTGDHVEAHCNDIRVVVVRNTENLGVGGAVMAGYRAAIADGADILVKIDGDGQMDPALVWRFVRPIAAGQADYTKGNRFYDLTEIGQMPTMRLVGNAVLSFMAKLSTGYWNVFDITNGYTAIHAKVAKHLPMDKISRRYFFETDMLFRLNIVRAVVVDVPMDAAYGSEVSNLRIRRIVGEFLAKHARNFFKRIAYNYFLRDMTVASLELVFGAALLGFGVVFGSVHWWRSAQLGLATPLGTIMLAALPTLVGLQMLLAFVGFDVANVPRRPIHIDLP
ncbi:glycosyltransferase family 2 protein [Ramlibacter albus]|uniref:Glycosyltransferase family 2 protein n=1 Tax=Ramlibacter albus TaxID=2079448 RepID=A0A923M8J6_9BURK|nr:glycosyltransferase family 2 protein [Ramlibacter albus]MBC5764754.1 glycosyltransferase family 2 protein [Ramlibacter albus]